LISAVLLTDLSTKPAVSFGILGRNFTLNFQWFNTSLSSLHKGPNRDITRIKVRYKIAEFYSIRAHCH